MSEHRKQQEEKAKKQVKGLGLPNLQELTFGDTKGLEKAYAESINKLGSVPLTKEGKEKEDIKLLSELDSEQIYSASFLLAQYSSLQQSPILEFLDKLGWKSYSLIPKFISEFIKLQVSLNRKGRKEILETTKNISNVEQKKGIMDKMRGFFGGGSGY